MYRGSSYIESVHCKVEDCQFWRENDFCSSIHGIVIDDRRFCTSFQEDFEKRKQNLKKYVSKIVHSLEH